MSIQWIKITTNIFDDEKIRLIETLPDADAIVVIWFKLLAMAGKCNDSGLIYLSRDIPYNDEMLSTLMRKPVNTVRLALQEFVNLKMIEIVNDFIAIINWEKHQNIEKLDMIKEKSRISSQKYREKQKEKLKIGDVTVTESDVIDKNRIDKNRIDKIYNEQMFNEMWDLYDKKTNKQDAIKEFKKIDEKHYNDILNHINKYVKTNEKKFRADFCRYLKKQYWENEIIEPVKTQSFREQNPAINDINEMSDEEASLYLKINQKQLGG